MKINLSKQVYTFVVLATGILVVTNSAVIAITPPIDEISYQDQSSKVTRADVREVQDIAKEVRLNHDQQITINLVQNGQVVSKEQAELIPLEKQTAEGVKEYEQGFLPRLQDKMPRLVELTLKLARSSQPSSITGKETAEMAALKRILDAGNFSKKSSVSQKLIDSALREGVQALTDIRDNRPQTGFTSDQLRQDAARALDEIEAIQHPKLNHFKLLESLKKSYSAKEFLDAAASKHFSEIHSERFKEIKKSSSLEKLQTFEKIDLEKLDELREFIRKNSGLEKRLNEEMFRSLESISKARELYIDERNNK